MFPVQRRPCIHPDNTINFQSLIRLVLPDVPIGLGSEDAVNFRFQPVVIQYPLQQLDFDPFAALAQGVLVLRCDRH